MAGRWSAEHRAFLEDEGCDVWLLTEVPLDAEISGMTAYRAAAMMQPHKSWAAVLGRVPPEGRSDPHRAVRSSTRGPCGAGDWNQALEGTDYVGTRAGRAAITDLLEASRLSLPTRSLGSATPGHRSIDHIAVPMTRDVLDAWRIPAGVRGRRLSDHDAHVVRSRTDAGRS